MAKEFWESITVYGDINYGGTARKIKGDFSNVTPTNRTALQSTTTDAVTLVPVVPNGTATIAGTQWWGSSSMANTHYGEVKIDADRFYITSDKVGTGSYKPIYIQSGGQLQIGTAATQQGIGIWGLPAMLENCTKHVYAPTGTVWWHAAGPVHWTENAYYHTSGAQWRYQSTAKAGRLTLEAGDWTFYAASSGTQDTGITWNTLVKIHDTGRVSIGTLTEGQKLDVQGGIRSQAASDGGGGGAGAEMDYLSGEARFFGYDRTNTQWLPTMLGGSTVAVMVAGTYVMKAPSVKSVQWWKFGTEPSWENSGTYRMKAHQLGGASALATRYIESDGTGANLYLLNNTYFNGTTWKRINATDVCGNLQLTNIFNLRRAASGTADSDITWTTTMITDTSDNLTVTGNVTAYSDARVKENVSVIQGALEMVRALTGVTYNRIDIEGKPRQMGLIAQEVQKVVPEVVLHDQKADRYSLSYGNLVALLIEAIKEQDERIRKLEREVLVARRK
jgi:hypothetical protein